MPLSEAGGYEQRFPEWIPWTVTLAVTSLVVGSAALATGGVLIYMNRPRRVRLDSEGKRLTITPALTPAEPVSARRCGSSGTASRCTDRCA